MSNVCNDQDEFNNAFYKALKYTNKKNNKGMANALAVYSIIHLIFSVWGVTLAFRSQPPENRIVHITLALMFAPAYVLAYYLNMF